MAAKKKKAKHRHKWETTYCDCPFHEEDHFDCECGATKIDTKIHEVF